MKKSIKYVALLLAGLLTISAIAGCQNPSGGSETTANSEDGNVTTAATTTNSGKPGKDNGDPEETMLSPESVYQKMLKSDDCKISCVSTQTVQGETTSMNYTISKDGQKYQLDYLLDYGTLGKIIFTDYINMQLGRYYYRGDTGDWVYQEESDGFEIGTLEDLLADMIQPSPDVLFADGNYEAFDQAENRYEMKRDVLLESMDGAESEGMTATLYMTRKGNDYVFCAVSELDGDKSEMECTISFTGVTVSIPAAQPDNAGEEDTDPPVLPDDDDVTDRAETPYTGSSLSALLSGLINTTQEGLLDPFTVYSIGFTPWQGEGIGNLFDGVKTEDDWFYLESGKCAGIKDDPAFFVFGMTEEVTVSAYVITTGNDNQQFPYRNPIEWTLYGTNDPDALDPDSFYTADWQVLDSVYDGNMDEINFTSYGYVIDQENRGSYRYYALMLEYSETNEFQACELELYAGELNELPEPGPGNEIVGAGEPYTGSALAQMLEGKTNIVADLGLMDIGSVRTYNLYPWDGEGPEHLFDGIKTYEQWYYDEDGALKEGAAPGLMEGGGPGKFAGEIYGEACIFFSLEEAAVLTAYVLTTANDNERFPYRNPIDWTVYGTNDPAAADCEYFYEADWEMLDYSRGGTMDELNFMSYGYTVDPAKQEAYQYYCFMIDYCIAYQFQLGEMELYTG